MSNIVHVTPEQQALDHLIQLKLAKLARSIETAVDREVSDMRFAISAEKAIGAVDERTANALDAAVVRYASGRKLANDKAAAIGRREINTLAVANMPGPRKATDTPTTKMRQLENAADRFLRNNRGRATYAA